MRNERVVGRRLVVRCLALLLLLSAAACSTVTCPIDTVVTCNYVFCDVEGATAVLQDTLNVDIRKYVPVYTYRKEGERDTTLAVRSQALTDAGYTELVSRTPKDTTLVYDLIGGAGFSVAMSYYNAVDTLVLRYRQIALPDTVWVWHDGYTHVENPECGSYRFHVLKEVRSTDRGIDRVEIVNPKVSNI